MFTSAGWKRQHGDKDMLSNWRSPPRPGAKSSEQGRPYNRRTREISRRRDWREGQRVRGLTPGGNGIRNLGPTVNGTAAERAPVAIAVSRKELSLDTRPSVV